MAAATRTAASDAGRQARRRYAERKQRRLALGELREALPAVAAPALPGAACQSEPPELWFPGEGDDGAKAIGICRRCPSRAQCLEAAIARGEEFGIWGGQNLELERAGHAGTPLAGLPPMARAARLAALRAEHRTVRATARAARMGPDRVRFWLDLLDLHPESQDKVRAGKLAPSVAVAAVRSVRRNARAS